MGLGLWSCVSQTVTHIDINQDLLTVHSWSIKGRVGISTENESWHASLFWQQDYERFELRFVAPLGQKTLLFKGDAGYARMQSSDGEITEGDNLERLISQRTGWYLPVYSLRFWIKGIPDPRLRVDKAYQDKDGHLSRLEQSGWTIQFKRYLSQNGLLLPSKVFFSNDDIKVRLAVSDWQVEKKVSKKKL